MTAPTVRPAVACVAFRPDPAKVFVVVRLTDEPLGIHENFVTGIDGDAKLLINVGATAPITLNHATGPNANARFAVPWAGNYVLDANGGAALIVYDSTSQVWRVV